MKDIEIAQHLAEEGIRFSNDLFDINTEYFNTLPNNYFAIASAIGLCWTGHAKYEDEFIEYAAGFIEGTTPHNPNISINFCKRFGHDELEETLFGFKQFYKNVYKIIPNLSTSSIQDINRLQQNLLNKLNELKSSGIVSHIGPWLFLGPFKIILTDQRRLWNNEGLNSIVLPTGMEVDKGIKRLKSKRFSFMKDFDLHWLDENTGSLLDEYATCNMVHAHIIKIADLANTKALHINSALYRYGKNEI
jgi:hypothetical protein